ncbi:MAG: GntR family transcriptional regulator [Lentisphaerae bacterium]|nr:GntR family transcriptional regulator [Lentisphaerota bacterium]OQC15409.1 MAG: putative HTH-type transcriptional regulator YurK [Lentisphaerae bacterium ADurb.Bin082]
MKKAHSIGATGLRAEALALLKDLRTIISESSPGRMLPSEWTLARKYNISRNTVAKTLKILVDEGLIERQVGRGTLVKGKSVITFLLPCPDFLSSHLDSACIIRDQMQGAMTAARERNLGFEMIAVSPTNDPNQIDFAQLGHLNAGSMVILGNWFRKTFPLLFERQAQVAMITKGVIPYGYAQYAKTWHRLNIDCNQGVTAALDLLIQQGCRKIILIGQYIAEARHPVASAYQKYMAKNGMPAQILELHYKDDESLTPSPANIIRQTYDASPFDGVLLGSGQYGVNRTIQSALGLPPQIKVCGIDQQFFSPPHLENFPYFSVPNAVMGYEAVKMLADNPGAQRQERKYAYDFYPGKKFRTVAV